MNQIGDADALAAEYVLGTLDSEEREQARSLISTDETFAAKVKLWERRLGELHVMVEPVEPDPKLWEQIKAKLPQVEPNVQVKPAEQPPTPEPATLANTESSVPSPTIVPAAGSETSAGSDAIPPAAEAGPEEEAAPPAEVPPPFVEPPVAAGTTPPPAEPATPAAVSMPAAQAERDYAVARRGLRRWRVLALLMVLIVGALAGLVAAWRFAPNRVPPALQPIELMRLVGVPLPSPDPPAPRPAPPPPDSDFEE
jgi:hypothetical protein